MDRLRTPGAFFTFQSLVRGQDPSQDLTWLLFGYNPKTNIWEHTGVYDRHPHIESLVKRANIMRDVLKALSAQIWDSEDRTCVRAFYTYLGIIVERRHPTTDTIGCTCIPEGIAVPQRGTRLGPTRLHGPSAALV